MGKTIQQHDKRFSDFDDFDHHRNDDRPDFGHRSRRGRRGPLSEKQIAQGYDRRRP